jgi:Flp pilus assembly protein TadB
VLRCAVYYANTQKEQREKTFGRTMLDDLNHTIFSVKYGVYRSKKMLWCFFPLLAILLFMNSMAYDSSMWSWVMIAAGFVLAALVGRWDYTRCQKPRLQNLEALPEKLTEEAEAPSL